MKAPLPSDEEVRVDLDVTSSSVIRAFGMAAWSVSVMVPAIVPEAAASGDCWATRWVVATASRRARVPNSDLIGRLASLHFGFADIRVLPLQPRDANKF